jgi:hypothetical protein
MPAGITVPVIARPRSLTTAAIGLSLSGAERINWDSDRSLSDFDLAVARPHFGEFSYDAQKDYSGQGKRSAQMRAYFASLHWRSEILPFLRAGKTLIVLLGKPEYFSLDALDNGPNHLWSWDLLDIPIAEASKLTVKKPKLTREGEAVFADHSVLLGCIEIGTTFKIEKGVPLLVTDDDTDRWLAARLEYKTGRIVVIPETVNWQRSPSSVANTALQKQVQSEQTALLKFALSLKQARTKEASPAWAASGWGTLRETQIEGQLQEIRAELDKLKSSESALVADQASLLEMRALLYSNGFELEGVVRRALRELGLDAQPSDDGKLRIDARFEHDGVVYVCEIEGKDNKAVDINKYRQLMDMCLGEQQRLGEGAQVRGVLIGNGYRLTPPSERKVQFTDQVLNNASTQGILLVTATDLYAAWRDATDQQPSPVAEKLKAAILSKAAGSYLS